MKRFICLFIAAAMVVLLFSCGDKAAEDDKAKDEENITAEGGAGTAAPEAPDQGGAKTEAPTEAPTDPPPPADPTGSCEFIGADTTTRGEWVGNYGNEGYLVLSREIAEQIPAYASVEFLDMDDNMPPHHVWYQESETDESELTDEQIEAIARRLPGALYTDPAKTDRAASCYYNGTGVCLNIDIGSETKYISVYSLDWDEQSRETEITVYDGSGKIKLVPSMEISEFNVGVYLKFKVSGSICLEYYNLTGGQNAVIGAVFFDSVN
ncbi:MAG: hypothetical protein FWD23_02930 [Oscillospiraceae bacterium]|nr:hypothetical protein [Oscillospiraceae bacterium]